MTTRHVGLIGFGSIGQSILKAWSADEVKAHRLAAILVRSRQVADAKAAVPPGIEVTDSIDEFLRGLDVAVEAAGHEAVTTHGEQILRSGVELVLLSVGSLADASVLQRLRSAAREGQSRILLPVGAVAGLDGLLALRRAGLSRVKYTSSKPPASWKQTPAEALFCLDSLTEPTVIFSGSAGEAASLYPKNANLAAAVALAGLGFDDTLVELVADPGSRDNVARIEAEGATSRLTVTVAGSSAPDNPKTSQITGMSVLSALDNEASLINFA